MRSNAGREMARILAAVTIVGMMTCMGCGTTDDNRRTDGSSQESKASDMGESIASEADLTGGELAENSATENPAVEEIDSGEISSKETSLKETASEETMTAIEILPALTAEEIRAAAAPAEDQATMYFYNRHDDYVEFTPEPAEISSEWIWYNDICLYTVFASKEADSIAYGDFRSLYASYWDSYANAASTHIGYELYFTLKDGTECVETILGPADTEKYFEYIEVYLYDDYHHAYGEWYSHVTSDEMTGDTYLTGVKLTTGEKIDEVADIRLTVFTYEGTYDAESGSFTCREADFDAASGRYIGGNYQTLHFTRA